MKVKSESEVAQSCPTLSDPHGLQPTRLLHPWNFPGKITGAGLPFPIPGDLPDPGIEPESLASPVLAVHGVAKNWTRLSDQYFHTFNRVC